MIPLLILTYCAGIAGSACLLAFDRPCGPDAGPWDRVELALSWPLWSAALLARAYGRAAARLHQAAAKRFRVERRGFEVILPEPGRVGGRA